MTVTDQDEAAERSARELERRIRERVPASLIADAFAFALEFKRWEIEHDWYCRAVPPRRPRGIGTEPTEEFKARKAAIIRKDDHDA